jgi:hypothetical protein
MHEIFGVAKQASHNLVFLVFEEKLCRHVDFVNKWYFNHEIVLKEVTSNSRSKAG